MPNKGSLPVLNILDRLVPRRGEGFGEMRCRYYCNNEKKVKYIAYQYGKTFTKDEAYDKVKVKRDKLIKILEDELVIRKEEATQRKKQKLADRPPPQKRGRKPKIVHATITIERDTDTDN